MFGYATVYIQTMTLSHFKFWAIMNKVAIKIQVQFIHLPNKGH